MTAADILRWALKGLRAEQDELARVQLRKVPKDDMQTWLALAEEILELREEERRLEKLQAAGLRGLPVLPGDTVFGVWQDDDKDVFAVQEERVTGVGLKGFTLPMLLDDPEDMSAVVPWAELGQSYFTTREAAEAIARELTRIREEGAHD